MDESTKGEAVTLREWELREMRRFGWMATAVGAAAVLQGFAGRWWLVAVIGAFGLILAGGAWVSWWLARDAQPWQEPTIRRPKRWELWLDGVLVPFYPVVAVAEFVDGNPLDAVSWLLVGAAMWVMFTRTRERRRLTEPAKVPARPGPPQEWIP